MTSYSAIEAYNRARWRATLEQLYARYISGRSSELLSYEEVRQSIGAKNQVSRGLHDIPLDSIVGSVGRYRDFTRSFLPKENTNPHRWANVKSQNVFGKGLPPIDVYKIGEVYFVSDGNHRVSVAREMDVPTIQAYVTEVLTKVPITPDMEPDDLIIAEQLADFLERTQVDELIPEADFRLTVPGMYRLLIEHIEAHKYFMGLDFERDISNEEAVVHWYEHVYKPVIDQIRHRGIMLDFPDRTESDLYVWLAENRAELETEMGWELSTESAVEAFADQHQSFFSKVGNYLYETFTGAAPEVEDELPEATGDSMPIDPANHPTSLFREILIAIDEAETVDAALEQGFQLADREEAIVRVLSTATEPEDQQFFTERFDEASSRHGHLQRRLAFREGEWESNVIERARWNSLVVVGLQRAHRTPKTKGSDLNALPECMLEVLRFSPRPILAVPRQVSGLTKALIPYDGSRRARQALFVGAYMATHWQIPIVVLTVGDTKEREWALNGAKAHLDRYEGVKAEYVGESGPVATNIFVTLESHDCDFIVMGGYPRNRLVERFLGSTGDRVLRNSAYPVLICQ